MEIGLLEMRAETKAFNQNIESMLELSSSLTRPNIAGNSCCSPDVIIPNKDRLSLWSKNATPLDRKSVAYGTRNTYIAQCIRTVNNGVSRDLNRRINYRCNEATNTPQSVSARYNLSMESGAPTVRINLYFDYEGNNRSEAYRKLRDTMPCVQDFYARHGIRLFVNISAEHPSHPIYNWVAWSMSDHAIDLTDHVDRANRREWSTQSASNPAMNASNRCALYAHELGHLLGLGDRYPKDSCPDRIIGARNELMRGGSGSRIENMILTPRDIRQILSPMCGD